MQSTNMAQMDSHAFATLRYIRASMEAAVSVAVPGSAGLAMGTVGLFATVLSSVPGLREHWLSIWLLAAVVAAGAGSALVAAPSLRELTWSATPIRNFVFCLFPSLFAGAVMTAVLWSSDNLRAIPGTWLLLYGCALIAASVATTSKLAVMGGLFVVLSLFAFLLPASFQMVILGMGFGGLHLCFGFLMRRMNHGRQNCRQI